MRLAQLAKLNNDPSAEAEYLCYVIQLPEATPVQRERLVVVLGRLGRLGDAAALWQSWAEGGQMPAGQAFMEAGKLRASMREEGLAVALLKRAMEEGAGGDAAMALERVARLENLWPEVVQALQAQLTEVQGADANARREHEIELLARLLEAQLQSGDGAGAEDAATRLGL